MFLWTLAGILAMAFLLAGAMKIGQPKERLTEMGLRWTDDFTVDQVRLIGAAEVLAAIGLILPALVNVADVLVPIAALGIVALMIGAAVVHRRRGEIQMIGANVVLLILASVIAWGRFGPYSF